MKYTCLILCLLFLFSCSNETDKQEQSNYIKNLENRIEIQEQNNYIKNLEERLKKLESSSNVRTSQDPKISHNDNSYSSFCLNFNKSICTKFDLEKVAKDIPMIIGKDGGILDKIKISKKNISGKDGKLYLHGESKETDGQKEKYELKKENGVWYFYENNKWELLSTYLTTSSY
tara:strand:+ start:277 stop:798 length:522 start_codon:yes stop_codon:yes gene_type:complete